MLSHSIYSQIIRLIEPWVRRKLARRATAEPLYGQYIEERFGQYTQLPGAGYVWIHAVSLGETLAAAILLRELRQQIPGMKLLLTHGTATGRAEGAKLLQAGDVQVWQPWDTPAATKRFFAHFKPCIGVVLETEAWPNLCLQAAFAGVPLVLANARLSDQSLRKAQRLAWLSKPVYASFSRVLAQTTDDVHRLRKAGARHVELLGNVKFDVLVDNEQLRRAKVLKEHASDKPVIMLAISREGEEKLFLEQIMAIAAEFIKKFAINNEANGLQWLIVPRHPQRFDEVENLCRASGLSVSRRSAWQASPTPADVWLGDSMGEMPLYYGLADVALLGGSFAPLGGQNLIQSIACECPVVMGPHTFNFEQACETAQQQGAALRVSDMGEGLQKVIELACAPARLHDMQQRGKRWLSRENGAARRMAEQIAQLLTK